MKDGLGRMCRMWVSDGLDFSHSVLVVVELLQRRQVVTDDLFC